MEEFFEEHQVEWFFKDPYAHPNFQKLGWLLSDLKEERCNCEPGDLDIKLPSVCLFNLDDVKFDDKNPVN